MSSGPKNFFATSLLQLQNQIKRDPSSYKDEVKSKTKKKFEFLVVINKI